MICRAGAVISYAYTNARCRSLVCGRQTLWPTDPQFYLFATASLSTLSSTSHPCARHLLNEIFIAFTYPPSLPLKHSFGSPITGPSDGWLPKPNSKRTRCYYFTTHPDHYLYYFVPIKISDHQAPHTSALQVALTQSTDNCCLSSLRPCVFARATSPSCHSIHLSLACSPTNSAANRLRSVKPSTGQIVDIGMQLTTENAPLAQHPLALHCAFRHRPGQPGCGRLVDLARVAGAVLPTTPLPIILRLYLSRHEHEL